MRDRRPDEPGTDVPKAELVGTALVLLVASAVAWANWPSRESTVETRANRVLVEKSLRRLTLLRDGKAIRTYHIALGRQPVGAKRQEGDRRTPEGIYIIDSRTAASEFHRALHISYPNPADRVAANDAGVDPGGAIFIHGIKNRFGWVGRAHRFVDWTAGCIAVTNPEIEQIWRLVPDGTVVEIRP